MSIPFPPDTTQEPTAVDEIVYADAKAMPPDAVPTLVAIAGIADSFKADEITAARFVVLVGAELAKMLRQ